MDLVVKSNLSYTLLTGDILLFELGKIEGTFGLNRTGQVVWDGAFIISRLLETKYKYLLSNNNGNKLNVLELGSGICCIPSLVAAYYGANVIITDISIELPLIQNNVNLNNNIINLNNVIVKELDWNKFLLSNEFNEEFLKIDLILCSDIIFGDNCNNIINTINKLLDINKKALIIMSNQNRLQVHKFRRSNLLKHFNFIDINIDNIINEFNLSSNQLVWEISINNS